MNNYNWSPEPKNDLNRPDGGHYDQGRATANQVPIEAGLERKAKGIVGCLVLAAATVIGGAIIYNNPITEAGRAKKAALEQLDDVAMIPVDIEASRWRQYARQELKDAGIDLNKAGAAPLEKLEYIVESGNGGDKPWAKSGQYHVPDVNGDGKFGGRPMAR